MEFEKAHYLATKEKVITMIKEAHPNWETTEGFVMDGVFKPDIYDSQKLKVLVILGETYGYAKCAGDYDLMNQAIEPRENDMLGLTNPTAQTPRKIAALLWLLLESIEIGRPVAWNDWPWHFSVDEAYILPRQLQSVLDRIAWINVKKTSNGTDTSRQDYNEVYSSAFKNEGILRLQIETIAPDLMIVCSDPVFNGLYDNGLLGQGVELGKKWEVQTNHLGQKIMQVSHPSYFRDWGYGGVYGTFEILYRSLQMG